MIKKSTKLRVILSISFFMLISISLKAQIKPIPTQDIVINIENPMNIFSKPQYTVNNSSLFIREFNLQVVNGSLLTTNYYDQSDIKGSKNCQLSQEVMDSVIYDREGVLFKDLYTFDYDGNNISGVFKYFDSFYGIWQQYFHTTFTYDENGNNLIGLASDWDLEAEEWVIRFRGTYTYNIDGNSLSSLVEVVDASGNWIGDWRQIFGYDSEGYLQSIYQEDWDVDKNMWVKSFRVDFSFDENKNPMKKVYTSWNGYDWVNLALYNFTYDNDNYWIGLSYDIWLTSGKWAHSTRSTYTNDKDGNRLTGIDERWNIADSTWTKLFNFFSTYDENGNLLTASNQTWSATELVWVNSSLVSFTYNENNNWLTFFSEVWNIEDSIWENNLLLSYTYNENENLTHFKSESWANSGWHLIDIGFYFMFNNKKFEYIGKELTAYLSQQEISSINNIELNDFSLSQNYPNPFNISTKIQYSLKEKGFVSLKVYDISGRVISNLINKEQPSGNYEAILNTNNQLQSGTYFYTLKVNNLSKTKKLIFNK